jgi:hypothetical protein
LSKRWVVERTFGWLGKYRRWSKDYEYLTASSEAMIYVAMIHLMVRRIEVKTLLTRSKQRSKSRQKTRNLLDTRRRHRGRIDMLIRSGLTHYSKVTVISEKSRGILILLEFALPFSFSSINLLPYHISMKTLFESKQAPRLSRFFISSIKTDEQQVGTNRQRHRPSHSVRIPSHLHPAQMQATLSSTLAIWDTKRCQ